MIVFIGYTTDKRPGIDSCLVTDKLTPKAKENFDFDLKFSKLTSRLTSVYAASPQYKSVFSAKLKEGERPLGVQFLEWLLPLYPKAFSYLPQSAVYGRPVADADRAILVGFDVAAFCRVCGVEATMANYAAPVGFWYANRDAFDPYEMLTEASQRNWLWSDGALLLSGIQHEPSWKTHINAKVDAKLAAELSFRHNLFAFAEQPSDSPLRFEELAIDGLEDGDEENIGYETQPEPVTPAAAPATRRVPRPG